MRSLPQSVLSPQNMVGTNASGAIYRIDDETAVRVYNFPVALDEIEREKTNARNTMLLGIPTLISFDVVQVGDDYGIIYENLESDTLGELCSEHPENFGTYVDDFTRLAKRMHSTSVTQGAFRSVKSLYSDYLDQTVVVGLFEKNEVSVCKRMLNAVPDRDSYLHMDLQPRTTLYCKNELTCYEMRDGAYGHPVFDLGASGLSTSFAATAGGDEYMWLITNMSCQNSTRFWKEYVRRYFSCATDVDVEALARLMLFAGFLKYMTVPVVYPPSSSQVVTRMQEICRERFLPHIDGWIASMEGVWSRFE